MKKKIKENWQIKVKKSNLRMNITSYIIRIEDKTCLLRNNFRQSTAEPGGTRRTSPTSLSQQSTYTSGITRTWTFHSHPSQLLFQNQELFPVKPSKFLQSFGPDSFRGVLKLTREDSNRSGRSDRFGHFPKSIHLLVSTHLTIHPSDHPPI